MFKNIGIIGGIIGNDLKEDFWGTLKNLSDMGYKGHEIGMGGKPQTKEECAEYKKKMDDLGMSVIALGTGNILAPEPDLGPVFEKAHALDCKYVLTWWGPCDSYEKVVNDAKGYNRIGEACRKAGLRFCYHNHDHEFRNVFNGKRAIDILLENTDPQNVYLECDVAWVTFGGGNPVEFLNANRGRIGLVHMKDIAGMEKPVVFTAVGTGIVDVAGVGKAAGETGVDWIIVEQDRPRTLTGMETVAACYLNMKELGVAP